MENGFRGFPQTQEGRKRAHKKGRTAMAGIKDVAREAGVAVSTVSKVLNNYPNVSKETKDKVNKAIKKLDFMPNAVAAALSSKQPGRVAILINQMTNAQHPLECEFHHIFLIHQGRSEFHAFRSNKNALPDRQD